MDPQMERKVKPFEAVLQDLVLKLYLDTTCVTSFYESVLLVHLRSVGRRR